MSDAVAMEDHISLMKIQEECFLRGGKDMESADTGLRSCRDIQGNPLQSGITAD